MDRVELRNLLMHHALDRCVLEPLGYHGDTFKVICEVVEEAMRVDNNKSPKKLKAAVRKLRRLKAGRHEQ